MNTRRSMQKWSLELRRTLSLAFPIMAGMVGQMMLGLADTLMVGRVGVDALAAAALVNTVTHIPLVFGIGLLASVSILASQAFGARKPGDVAEVFRHGLLLAVLAGVMVGVSLMLIGPHLQVLGQPRSVVDDAQVYLLLFSWSMLPMLIAHAGKQFCEALNDPWPPMLILTGAVVLNIFLNWVFIYGNLGSPAFGLEGAGIATLIARFLMGAVTIVFILMKTRYRSCLPLHWFRGWSLRRLVRLVTLGTPVAVQHLMEVGAFAAAALMMGWIGPQAMAAHQIAISCAATTFMLALGVGMAVTIRVGHAWGAGLKSRLRRIVYGGLMLGVGSMAVFAVAFMLEGDTIAGWFLDAPEVIQLAAAMLLVAGFFQVADGTQVVMISALRGMSDVRLPAIIAVVAYWVVALPLAGWLAFYLEMGAIGIWIGLASGLGVAALGLSLRFVYRSRELRTPRPVSNTIPEKELVTVA